MIALCGKLIRIAYTLITKDVAYDPIKMMGDIHQGSVTIGNIVYGSHDRSRSKVRTLKNRDL